MSKYADLPDIDNAPDVYETEDFVETTELTQKAEPSDDETAPSRTSNNNNRNKKRNEVPTHDELDQSGLVGIAAANRHFKKLERKHKSKVVYDYPPSPDSSSPIDDVSGASRPVSLSQRLRILQAELSSLEHEISDPSNPLLRKEREEENVDPGELIRGLVDVRGRLEKIRKGNEGRGRLVGAILEKVKPESNSSEEEESKSDDAETKDTKSNVQNLVETDRRLGELEKLVGSSNVALDESSPLPTPLLPLITRLSSQLTLLTQPRHLDSISRRLKLLLSDLERASAAQQHRRHQAQTSGVHVTPIPEHLIPILSRLGPALPQIPHILTRLRTLSALHTSAAEFHSTLNDLETEYKKVHQVITELDHAVKTVEHSLEENKSVVKNNVAGLENRVESLLQRLESADRD